MRKSLLLLGGALVFFGLARISRADDSDYKSLLKRLPEATTAIILIDVPALRNAIKVTKGTATAQLAITQMHIPASKFVMGAQLDLSERRHICSISLVKLDGPFSIEDVSKTENEPVEKIGDYSVVASQRNVCFIDLGPGLIAIGTPANRQMLVRWLKFQKDNQLDLLPPYLQEAARQVDSPLITIAIDLTDHLGLPAIERWLARSDVLSSRSNVDFGALAKTIASVQGLTLTVRAGDPLTAEISVDFQKDIEPFRSFGKELLLETLQNTGLYFPDFDDWELRVPNKQAISIRGPLSISSLRKLGTLIGTRVPSPEANKSASPEQRALAASRRYFEAVTQIVDDLKADKFRKMDMSAGWYAHADNEINNLPTQDVAPELVKYGAQTAEHLRAASTGFHDVSQRIGYVRRNSSYYGYAAPRLEAALREKVAEYREQVWKKIDDSTEQIRQAMRKKFNAQF
jgi:hypothetical protein